LYEICQVAKGVYCLTRPLEGYGMNVSCTLIVAAGQAIIIDTFSSPRHLEPFLEFLGTLQTAKGSLLAHESHGFENPDAIPKLQSEHSNCVWVVYSHGDWDHCLGTGAVEDALGPSGISHVVSHRLTRCRLAEEGLKDIQELKIINPPLVEGAKVVLPNITFSERLTLHIGSQRVCTGDRGFQISGLRGEVSSASLELNHVGGHTQDSIACYLAEEKVLIAGDLAEDPLPSVGDPFGLDKWIECLEYYSERANVVIPSHGKAQGPDILRRNAKYLGLLRQSAKRSMENRSLSHIDPETFEIVDSLMPHQKACYLGIHQDNANVLDLACQGSV
jgi:glyoxylase-like metal-dependent hydrolase (beta-lactamase superfamily II)